MLRLATIPHTNVARGVILKVHSRCNLACDYCYMFDAFGKPVRPRTKVMSRRVIDQTARRVREYMNEQRLGRLSIVLHGGEPLLAGIEKIRYIVDTFRKAAPEGTEIEFSMQTNATLVTNEIADELLRLGIGVGASLDGDLDGNSHRPYHSGRSTFDDTLRGIEILKQREILDGLLAVIHPENDPMVTTKTLVEIHPSIDYLFPVASWKTEPTERPPITNESARHGLWLVNADRQWLSMGGPGEGIRTVNKLLNFVAAAYKEHEIPYSERVEWIGPWCVGDLVVETDGRMERLDGLNRVVPEHTQTGYNVFEHRLTYGLVAMLEATLAHGIVLDTKQGPMPGSPICQQCEMQAACGGGHFLHRYGPRNGYVNPSVYCADIQLLMEYVWSLYMRPDVQRRLRERDRAQQ